MTRRIRQAFQVGSVIAVGLLPRPISIAAGLGWAGMQIMNQGRRMSN